MKRTKRIEKLKKITGLMVALAMVAGMLYVTGVESKADGVPSQFPQVGDDIIVYSHLEDGGPDDSETEHYTVCSIDARVISSPKWQYSLTVYFYKLVKSGATSPLPHSYLLSKVRDGVYIADRELLGGDSNDENCIQKMLDGMLINDQTHIQGQMDSGYTYCWNYPPAAPSAPPVMNTAGSMA